MTRHCWFYQILSHHEIPWKSHGNHHSDPIWKAHVFSTPNSPFSNAVSLGGFILKAHAEATHCHPGWPAAKSTRESLWVCRPRGAALGRCRWGDDDWNWHPTGLRKLGKLVVFSMRTSKNSFFKHTNMLIMLIRAARTSSLKFTGSFKHGYWIICIWMYLILKWIKIQWLHRKPRPWVCSSLVRCQLARRGRRQGWERPAKQQTWITIIWRVSENVVYPIVPNG